MTQAVLAVSIVTANPPPPQTQPRILTFHSSATLYKNLFQKDSSGRSTRGLSKLAKKAAPQQLIEYISFVPDGRESFQQGARLCNVLAWTSMQASNSDRAWLVCPTNHVTSRNCIIVTTSITDREKNLSELFPAILDRKRKYSKRINLTIFGPIADNTLPFTDSMTLRPELREQNPVMNHRMKIPQQ